MSQTENPNSKLDDSVIRGLLSAQPDIFALAEIIDFMTLPGQQPDLSREARQVFIGLIEKAIGSMADKAKKLEQGNNPPNETVSTEIHQMMKTMEEMGKLRDAYLALNMAEDNMIEGVRGDVEKIHRQFGIQPKGSADIIDSIYRDGKK